MRTRLGSGHDAARVKRLASVRERRGGDRQPVQTDQLLLIVRRVGKARARRYLRQLIEFDMVPKADLLGV